MSTVMISAQDINKLRQATGAGMMDCRKALTETNGDFEAAIDWLRKQGQKVAAKRSDREAKEGVVIAQTTADNKTGIVVCVSCETDFVSKNADFIAFAKAIKSAFFDTKSVSQLTHTTMPVLLSAVVCAITTPSLASRSLRLAATFCPCLRSQSMAASKSPLVSVRALRQSIIPAPVA